MTSCKPRFEAVTLNNGVDERSASAQRTDQIRLTSDEKHPALSVGRSGSGKPRERQFGASDLHIRLAGAVAVSTDGNGRPAVEGRGDRGRMRARLADARAGGEVETTGADWAGHTGAEISHCFGTISANTFGEDAGAEASACE